MFFGIFTISGVPSLAWFMAGIFMNNGELTFQDFVAAFFAVQFAGSAVQQALAYAPEKSKAIVAIASIFNILDRKSRIDSSITDGQNATAISSLKMFALPTRCVPIGWFSTNSAA